MGQSGKGERTMNAYFSRTPESFNYDGAQYPGEGNLYDLRVATRDEIERLDRDITYIHDKLTERIEALEEAMQSHVEDIGGNAGRISEMTDWSDELENRISDLELEIAQMRTNHINMDDEIGQIADRIVGIEQNERRQERLSRHGKYAHLTESQIGTLVAALKVYADYESWRVSKPGDKKPWFRNETERPWTLARKALEDIDNGLGDR
jgi:hypothetical protein